jgi:hypothetical protein
MAKFTLLEVHLEDATFTANAPYSGESGEAAESEDEDDENEPAGGSGGPGKGLVALLALVALLVLAYLGSRRLGGEDVPDVAVEEEFES